MPISDILPELLFQIFRYNINSLDSEHYRDKYALPIQSVCRIWRSICMPLIYESVKIECISRIPKATNTSRHHAIAPLVTDPPVYTELISDLSLMPTMCSGLPRTLTIDISYHDNPIECVRAIITATHKHKNRLLSVNRLKINALLVSRYANQSQDTLEAPLSECMDLAKCLTRDIPNISNLVYTNLAEEPLFKHFIQIIATEYDPQLTQAEVETSSLKLVPALSESIRALNIMCLVDMHIPDVHTESLKSLKLTGLGNTFNWSALEDKVMPGHINLPNLEHFYIGTGFTFAEVYEDNVIDPEYGYGAWVGLSGDFPFRMNAPKLQILQMQVCPNTCSLLLSLDCPSVLQKLELIFIESMTVCMRNVQINSTVKAVFRKHAGATDGVINAIEFINDILQIPDMAQQISVHVLGNLSISALERTRWHYLHELVLESQVFSGVFDIIRHVPSLRKLKAKHVIPYPLGMFTPGTEASSQMQRLMDGVESSLEYVDIEFNPEASKEIRDKVGELLRANITSLKCLRIR